jgi:molybdopterin-binding protein
MAISARNQLKGKITEVVPGNVMAQITIENRPRPNVHETRAATVCINSAGLKGFAI